MYGNYDFKPCLAKSKAFFVYMVIVISIHQVADKSVTWKLASQATKVGAIWLQLIGQEAWLKLSYFFDKLSCHHKSLRNPSNLVCSRNDYILWYKIQKFKKCKNISGYALALFRSSKSSFDWSNFSISCLLIIDAWSCSSIFW